ncbi:MAG: N-acetylmuramoyl-L-alanine amidase [bacterium]|nr:N-acetylmuramoyl-L-alanine amidase [bacterium]
MTPMKSIEVYGAVSGSTQNESLKQSAVNMIEAILNITNTSGSVTEPTTGVSNNPSTNSTPSPTLHPNKVIPKSPGTQQANCPSEGKLNISNSQYSHLNRYLDCDKPRMIVIHWSGGWSSAQVTFNTLNERDRSCQFAIDENTTIQMLDHYPDLVERGWCAGEYGNVGSINFEITGSYFDSVLLERNQNPKRYEQLITMTDKTVALTCKFIQMYSIPKSAIYGHYQLQSGKPDPGVEYLKFFKQRVNQAC